MKKNYFLLLLLIVVSCQQKSEQQIIPSITVNPSEADSACLSEIASGIDMIILETDESCLIRGIQEIEKSSQYFFINDAGKRLLQFDISGKFIRQIGSSGRGPGEYTGITGIAIDDIRSAIYVSAFNKILCYDFSGRFLREFKANYSEFITYVNDKLWTVSTKVGVKNANSADHVNTTNLIRFDSEGKIYDTIVVKKVILPSFSGTIFPQAYYISDPGTAQYLYYPVLVPEPEPVLRDTLYEVKDNKLIPSIKLDFGKAGEIINGKKQVFIRSIYRTGNYLFADYLYGRKELIFCFNISRVKAYNVKEGFIDDYFKTGIVQLRPLSLNNETLYFIKEPFDIKGNINGVSENSNPVIFIVKLKNK